MTYQWPSRLPDYTSSDISTTDLSPLTCRPLPRQSSRKDRRNVPRGTVASRISYIQSVANPTLANITAQSVFQRRERSCTGWCQRVNSRFGEPASRNTRMMEQTQVDSAHSFLGLNIARKNHEEEHAIAKHRVSFDRTPGLHGQLKPQGFVQLVQYDAASPWPVLSNGSTPRNSRKSRSESVIGVLKEDNPYESRNRGLGSEHQPFQESVDMYQPNISIRRRENCGSDSSILTTSDIRRQSVRDLYRDFGVERPRHLVSSRGSSRDVNETPRPATQTRHCLHCSWANTSKSNRCLGCGHKLRDEIDASATQKTPKPATHPGSKNGSVDGGSNSPKHGRLPEKLQIKPVPATYVPQRPGLGIFQPSQPIYKPARKKSTATVKFPSFDANIVATKPSSRALPKFKASPRRMTPPILPPSRSQIRLSVKQNPFLVADAKAREDQSKPTQAVAQQSLSPERHHSQQHIDGKCDCTDNSTVADEPCESPSCRAAYNGHKPSRHTLTCSQQKDHLREKTDLGYTADISHGEEGNEATHKPRFQLPSENDLGHLSEGSDVHHAPRSISRGHMNSSAVPSRKGTMLATELRGRYSSVSHFSQQSHEGPSAESGNSASELLRNFPKMRIASLLNEDAEQSNLPPWQSFNQPTTKIPPGSSIGDHVKKALRDEPNTDSSADTQSELGKLQSFSTHRPSLQTNITTPDRSSLCKPSVTAPAIPTRKTSICPKHATRGEAAPLIIQGPCAATEESRQARRASTSIVSPRVMGLRSTAAVPELTIKVQHRQKELNRLENELNDIKERSDECQNHHAAVSEHEEKHTQTRKDQNTDDAISQIIDAYHSDHAPSSPQHDESNSHPQKSLTPTTCPRARKLHMKLINPALEPHWIFDRNVLAGLARDGYPYSPSPARQSDMHECIWRRLFLEEQRSEIEREGRRVGGEKRSVEVGKREMEAKRGEDIRKGGDGEVEIGGKRGVEEKRNAKREAGLRGLTVVVHWEGKEDLVLVCDV
ncbi:hypothetical protein GLAREA_08886 [Glarea lozoyensis ATCC 20868]|uniref:Uncharacterized protein n=1 Tax=Glarea lozoyensis (strain ATCC 20868 / MF5171) TaxID=1116229 RepID=S3EET4_GLAL2|nr:uncharacterized protein GLAREA_08886 [Glarea lozoyensis ATCC 20868]EPE36723.1 hypothetical protein GLAREA_08886 [Glarea lozoyensis ATCC 20868]